MTELSFIQRDQIVANVYACAAAEGLTHHGMLQAAVRFGYEAAMRDAENADRAQRTVPDPSPTDERLIRDDLEEFAVRHMESQNLNLSDGMKPLTEWNTGGKPLNTDQIIRMVQSTLRAYVNRDA